MNKKKLIIALFIIILLVIILWFSGIIPKQIGKSYAVKYMNDNFSEMELQFINIEWSREFDFYTIQFKDKNEELYGVVIGPKYLPINLGQGLFAIEEKYRDNSDKTNDSNIENNVIENENTVLPIIKNKEEIQKEVSNLYQTLEEYISIIYNNFQGGIPLSEFDNIKKIDDYYLNVVAYLNCNMLRNENFDYTYDELNNLIVALFGEEANNVLFSSGDTYPFEGSNQIWNRIGMGFAEGLTYDFVINKIEKIDDKTNEVYIVEYSLDRGPHVLLNKIEYDGVKEVIKNNKDEIIDEFTYKAEYIGDGNYENEYDILNEDIVISKLSKDGVEVTDEYIEEYVKNNIDKFGLTKLVIEHDKDLDLFYLKSCKRIK